MGTERYGLGFGHQPDLASPAACTATVKSIRLTFSSTHSRTACTSPPPPLSTAHSAYAPLRNTPCAPPPSVPLRCATPDRATAAPRSTSPS